ncbi:HET-domain-containing protein, partial [Lophium mytilinum]
MMAKDYRHTPLTVERNIRILQLQPASQGSQLQGRLIEVSLDDTPYRALSYVWGPQNPACYILCSGKRLQVTSNCEQALLRLRHRKKPQLWWIDAICIDQTPEGLEERSSQVSMMGEIYSKAHETVAWLGEGDDLTKKHMRLIILIGGLARLAKCMPFAPKTHTVKQLVKRILRYFDERSECHGLKSHAYGLRDLIGSEYFQRAWTMQEVALSKHCYVYCHKSKVRWTVFSCAADNISTTYLSANTPDAPYVHGILNHLSLWEVVNRPKHGQRLPLSAEFLGLNALLLFIMSQKATNAKDKIFSIHGVCEKLGISLPAPDYTKPECQVYAEATFSAIAHTKSLEIFKSVNSDLRPPELPSWAPDWSVSNRQILQVASRTYNPFSASKRSEAYPSPSVDWRKMILRGKRVGNIQCREIAISKRTSSVDTTESTSGVSKLAADMRDIKTLQRWIRFANPQSTFVTADADILDSPLFHILNAVLPTVPGHLASASEKRLWYNLMLPRPSAENQGSEDPAEVSSFGSEDTASHLQANSCVPSLLDLVKDPSFDVLEELASLDPPCRYHWTILSYVASLVLFRTSTNLLGIACHTVEPGDAVVLLQGGAMAYILRGDGDCYRLIGQAFIHGLMNGEEWPDRNEELEEL